LIAIIPVAELYQVGSSFLSRVAEAAARYDPDRSIGLAFPMYVEHLEQRLGRAFPNLFAEARKTMRQNIEAMKGIRKKNPKRDWRFHGVPGAGGGQQFKAPFAGDAALYLQRE
jgi:hypothetical protein